MVKTTALIIGAGPTGLMMACQLAVLDVPFIIVEKDSSATYESRAIGIQARTLEIFSQMGISGAFVEEGEKATDVDLVGNGKIVGHLKLSGLGDGLTKFPFLLLLEQSRTEAILLEFLKTHKKTVSWDTVVLSLEQNEDGTISRIKYKNGKEETVEADYIIGADGAHSIVRHSLGIELAGKTYKQSLFVLDCNIASPVLSPTHLSVVFSDTSFSALFPMKNNRWRVVSEVPPRLYGKDTITFEDINTDFARRMKLNITLSSPYWISLYHAHHRCVSTFKKGRCFLVGDSAHIHSPVGAQGMNTGLQDAYNLGWKLAFVYKKLAYKEILETFNQDRLPFAKKLVETTDRAFNMIILGGKLGSFFRTKIAPKLAKMLLSREFFGNIIFKIVSQIGVSYHNSSLSKDASFGNFPKLSPKPGDRLPYILYTKENKNVNIQDEIKISKMQLLIFTGNSLELFPVEDIAKKYDRAIGITKIELNDDTKTLYEKFGIKNRGYYLVRPDMYVAFRNNSENAVEFEQYISKILI